MSLKGVRVVEAGGGFASRFAGFLLAAAGAEVTVAVTASGGIVDEDEPTYVYWATLAAWLDSDKRFVSASLRTHFDDLAGQADVVVEDLQPDERLRLGFAPVPEQLTVPWVAITPFGAARWVELGSDLTAAAIAAAVWPIGRPDREPLTMPYHQASIQAGTIAAMLAAAAIVGASAPRLIDVAIAEVVAAYATVNGSLFVWEREGHRAAHSGGAYPYTLLPCADGYVCLVARSNAEWRRLLRALGNPDWASDARFQDVREIARFHADEADELMRGTLARFTREQLLARAAEVGCAIAPVRDFEDLVVDPDLRRRGIIVDREAAGRSVAVPRLPWLERLANAAPDPRAPKVPTDDPWQPLAGKRILDFGWVVSAPLVGMLTSALGADVIKVESMGRSDNMRLRGALRHDGIDWSRANNSPTFHLLNRGKRSFGVNLKTEAGQELIKQLVRTADAVVENYTVGAFERLGLDDRTLAALHPDLVRLSLTAAGRDGRLATLRGYAATTGALAGLEGSVGYASEPGPTGMLTFGIADYAAGALAAFVLVAALHGATGYRSIDASQMEANVVGLGEGFAALAARWPTRPGNRSYLDAPCGVYRCTDGGYIALEVAGDDEWGRLARLLSLLHDDSFTTASARRAAADRLNSHVAAWTALIPRDEAVGELKAHRLRAAPVLNLAERKTYELFISRGFDVPITMGNGETVLAPSAPWLAGTRPGSLRRAPGLGESTDEICRDLLGLGSDRIEALKACGVLEVPVERTV